MGCQYNIFSHHRIPHCKTLTHFHHEQDSLTNRDRHKLSEQQRVCIIHFFSSPFPSRNLLVLNRIPIKIQLERKLNAVSKHRHYAKDLVLEQKRRNCMWNMHPIFISILFMLSAKSVSVNHFSLISSVEKRRMEQEEKEIEREEKQLIRRKQLLLRKNSEPHFKRRFPSFTAGRSDSEEEETGSGEEYESEETDEYDQESNNKAQNTLQALTEKLSILENELETIKTVKSREQSPRKVMSDTNAMENEENISGLENGLNGGDMDFNMERIQKTLKAAEEKRAGKTINLTMPTMPSMPSMPSMSSVQKNPPTASISNITSNMSQPPHLSVSSGADRINEAPRISTSVDTAEDKAVSKALGSLDVSSLMMLLDKMKIYFKEIQIEKKENEEFRSSILTSVNAQNTQILHLLSQLAAQQKEMNELKETVTTLKDKVSTLESAGSMHSGPKWTKSSSNMMNSIATRGGSYHSQHEIEINDIKKAIADSRPSTARTEAMLESTDWKSISNVLTPKYDTFQNSETPQNPYTVQRHKVTQKRSFLPSAPVQSSMTMKAILPSKETEDAMIQRAAPPPQPVPKPQPAMAGGTASRFKQQSQRAFLNIQQAMNDTAHNASGGGYPKVIVQKIQS